MGKEIVLKICEEQEEGESGWTHVAFFANKSLAEDYVSGISHVLMRIVDKPESFIKELASRDARAAKSVPAKPSDEKR